MIKKVALLILLILLMSIYGCIAPVTGDSKDVQEKVGEGDIETAEEENSEPQGGPIIIEEEIPKEAESAAEESESAPRWVYGGNAIEGNYADSDFVDLGDGKYRMYYATEPEVPGNKLEVYSATSS